MLCIFISYSYKLQRFHREEQAPRKERTRRNGGRKTKAHNLIISHEHTAHSLNKHLPGRRLECKLCVNQKRSGEEMNRRERERGERLLLVDATLLFCVLRNLRAQPPSATMCHAMLSHTNNQTHTHSQSPIASRRHSIFICEPYNFLLLFHYDYYSRCRLDFFGFKSPYDAPDNQQPTTNNMWLWYGYGHFQFHIAPKTISDCIPLHPFNLHSGIVVYCCWSCVICWQRQPASPPAPKPMVSSSHLSSALHFRCSLLLLLLLQFGYQLAFSLSYNTFHTCIVFTVARLSPWMCLMPHAPSHTIWMTCQIDMRTCLP